MYILVHTPNSGREEHIVMSILESNVDCSNAVISFYLKHWAISERTQRSLTSIKSGGTFLSSISNQRQLFGVSASSYQSPRNLKFDLTIKASTCTRRSFKCHLIQAYLRRRSSYGVAIKVEHSSLEHGHLQEVSQSRLPSLQNTTVSFTRRSQLKSQNARRNKLRSM